MGWYAHPDTLCIAHAQGIANRTGHTSESIEWLQTYRDAYQKIAGEEAADYIRQLDARLGKMKFPGGLT